MFVMLKKELKFLEEIKKGKREGRKQNQNLSGGTLTDANDIPRTIYNTLQVYRVRNTSLNIPIVAHGFILHMDIDSAGYAIQLYVGLSSSSMSVVYCRSKFMGEWIDWRVIG